MIGGYRNAATRHRELGDVALIMSGFFSEVLEHRGVSQGSVHELGKAAYLRAAELIAFGQERATHAVLTELGRRFGTGSP